MHIPTAHIKHMLTIVVVVVVVSSSLSSSSSSSLSTDNDVVAEMLITTLLLLLLLLLLLWMASGEHIWWCIVCTYLLHAGHVQPATCQLHARTAGVCAWTNVQVHHTQHFIQCCTAHLCWHLHTRQPWPRCIIISTLLLLTSSSCCICAYTGTALLFSGCCCCCCCCCCCWLANTRTACNTTGKSITYVM